MHTTVEHDPQMPLLAHDLGFRAAVQGVETPASHAAVRQMACGEAQGFRACRSLSAAVPAWLDRAAHIHHDEGAA